MFFRGGIVRRPVERLAIVAVLIALGWPVRVDAGAVFAGLEAAGPGSTSPASVDGSIGGTVSSLDAPNDPAPAAPIGLTATPGNNKVSLRWSANGEPDIAGYNVYRDGGPVGSTVQAVGAGDIASCSSTGDEATAALLATISGDVLALGDTVYDSGTATEYANCYNPSWGQEKTRTRPVVGNHEYGTANASGYFTYFGAAAGTQGQGWYSYDYGAWHVVVLNSMCANVGGCGTGSAQLTWLVADLAANDTDCTMALWHHPRFSSSRGADATTQPLYQALYNANADLILTGHDHTYERFAPQTATGVLDNTRGIRQFVVGTGGRSHYTFDNPQPNSEIRNGDSYGVIKLKLNPTSFAWEFVPEAGKSFSDIGSDECHDGNGPIISGSPLNGALPVIQPWFTDTTSLNGSAHTYRVTAVDEAGQESPVSLGVTETPVAGPPVTQLSPLAVSSDTSDKPQSKLWFHAGTWWAVLPSTSVSPAGTWVWKLAANGTWLNALRVSAATDTRADVTRVGDLTHVLLYGASPELVSLEYNASTGTYQPWSMRAAPTAIALPNSETATIEVDFDRPPVAREREPGQFDGPLRGSAVHLVLDPDHAGPEHP